MWTQGLNNGQQGQLYCTTIARAIINRVKRGYRRGTTTTTTTTMTTNCQLANGDGVGERLKPARSQLESLATCTVPVNLNPPLLLSRHTPTRRSMQRSRILNLNLAGRRRPKMRYYRFLIFLAVVQLLVGGTLTAVSIYASTVSPSLRIRDLPHWAGIPLFLSGFLGVAYVTRCYGDLRINPMSDIFKAVSWSLAAVSIVLCTCAVAFHYFHMNTFAEFIDCVNIPYPAESAPATSTSSSSSVDVRHHQLVDTFEPLLNQDLADLDDNDSSTTTPSGLVSCTCFRDAGAGLKRRYLYERIACDDVLALIKFLFIIMSMLGCLGTLDCAVYVVLLWVLRYKDIYVDTKSGIDRDTSCAP